MMHSSSLFHLKKKASREKIEERRDSSLHSEIIIPDSKLSEALLTFEKFQIVKTYKFGVLYREKGQVEESVTESTCVINLLLNYRRPKMKCFQIVRSNSFTILTIL
jgi:hypothetical protein